MPSRASICNLLGDLYVKLDNIRAAATYFWECLKLNPYKISAYIKLCDISPDCPDFNKAMLPKDVFVDFDPMTTDLSKSSNLYLPPQPSPETCEISFSAPLSPDEIARNRTSMPRVRDDYHDITVNQLKSLIKYQPNILEEDSPLIQSQPQRYVGYH